MIWFPIRLIIYILLTILFLNFDFFSTYLYRYGFSNTIQETDLFLIKELTPSIVNFKSVQDPIKIKIPVINLETKIVETGKTRLGNMDVPNSLIDVGWYKLGVRPGEVGNAVIAGHEVDSLGYGAIFKNLHLLKSGDIIVIETKSGQIIKFKVLESEIYKYNNSPLEKIFGAAQKNNLNLITCSGDFVSKLNTKDERLVVYSTQI